jgi:hypothetical protein
MLAFMADDIPKRASPDLDFASGDLSDDDPEVIEGLKRLAEIRALEERRRKTLRAL